MSPSGLNVAVYFCIRINAKLSSAKQYQLCVEVEYIVYACGKSVSRSSD